MPSRNQGTVAVLAIGSALLFLAACQPSAAGSVVPSGVTTAADAILATVGFDKS